MKFFYLDNDWECRLFKLVSDVYITNSKHNLNFKTSKWTEFKFCLLKMVTFLLLQIKHRFHYSKRSHLKPISSRSETPPPKKKLASANASIFGASECYLTPVKDAVFYYNETGFMLEYYTPKSSLCCFNCTYRYWPANFYLLIQISSCEPKNLLAGAA